MTDTTETETPNLPAVIGTTNTERTVARADTDSWVQIVGEVAKLAQYVAGTEFVPKSLRDSPAAVTAAIMYGREVGLAPMTALTQTHVIEGKPAISAAAQRALVLAAGHEIETVESTGAICRMRARRRGSERWGAEVVWTLDMARAAGLLGKNVWKSYPRAMLLARCSGELCGRDFPDVVLGFATVEEIEDAGGEEGTPPAETTSTTKVARRSSRKAAPPAAVLPPAARPSTAPAGPPLPGEDGTPDVVPEGTPAAAPVAAPDLPVVEGEAVEVEVEELPTDAEIDPTAPPVEDRTPRAPAPASGVQRGKIFATLGDLGVDDVREERILIASKIVNREIESFNDLTKSEASHLIDTLAQMPDKAALWALLDGLDGVNVTDDES